jgi:hypothetical protein
MLSIFGIDFRGPHYSVVPAPLDQHPPSLSVEEVREIARQVVREELIKRVHPYVVRDMPEGVEQKSDG